MVGFNSTGLTVSESDGLATACVTAIAPSPTDPVTVNVFAIGGTATGKLKHSLAQLFSQLRFVHSGPWYVTIISTQTSHRPLAYHSATIVKRYRMVPSQCGCENVFTMLLLW